jgi:hypothetical protein
VGQCRRCAAARWKQRPLLARRRGGREGAKQGQARPGRPGSQHSITGGERTKGRRDGGGHFAQGHVPPRPAALLPVAKLTSRGRKARGRRESVRVRKSERRGACGTNTCTSTPTTGGSGASRQVTPCPRSPLAVCLMFARLSMASASGRRPSVCHCHVMSDSHKPIVRSAHVHPCPPEAGNQLLPVIQCNAGNNTCLRLLGLPRGRPVKATFERPPQAPLSLVSRLSVVETFCGKHCFCASPVSRRLDQDGADPGRRYGYRGVRDESSPVESSRVEVA